MARRKKFGGSFADGYRMAREMDFEDMRYRERLKREDYEGLMYDRAMSKGDGEVDTTEIPLDGSPAHVTQYDRYNNTRVSWNTDGTGAHMTDQNYGKGHPWRHG